MCADFQFILFLCSVDWNYKMIDDMNFETFGFESVYWILVYLAHYVTLRKSAPNINWKLLQLFEPHQTMAARSILWFSFWCVFIFIFDLFEIHQKCFVKWKPEGVVALVYFWWTSSRNTFFQIFYSLSIFHVEAEHQIGFEYSIGDLFWKLAKHLWPFFVQTKCYGPWIRWISFIFRFATI